MTGRLIATHGLPASGKTGWARRWVAINPGGRDRVNRDDLRRMLHGGWLGTAEQEAAVTAVQHAGVAGLVRLGRAVVVDDTNLVPEVMQGWHDLAGSLGVALEIEDFTYVGLEECVRRNSRRVGDERVPESVIRDMHAKYLAEPAVSG